MTGHRHIWSADQVEELRAAVEAKLPELLKAGRWLDAEIAKRRPEGAPPIPPADLVAIYITAAVVNERFDYQRTGETMCDECLFELVKELRRQVWEACPLPSPHPIA